MRVQLPLLARNALINAEVINGCALSPCCLYRWEHTDMARPITTVAQFYQMHPEFTQRVSGRNAKEVCQLSKSSTTPIWFFCSVCNGEYQAQPKSKLRANRDRCPYCSGKLALPGFNDLASARPDLVSQWHRSNSLSPDEVTAHSGYKAMWVCPANPNHTWMARINDRNPSAGKAPSGCPKCAQKRVAEKRGKNQHQNMVSSGEYLPDGNKAPAYMKRNLVSQLTEPISIRSKRNLTWKCDKGHIFNRSPKDYDGSCPKCDVFSRSLKALHPDIASQWHPKNASAPDEVTYNSAQRVWWLCSQGHEWECTVYQRVNSHTGCPVCANNGVSAGEIELADFIASIMGADEVVVNDRSIIAPKELDIYIPSRNVAIEFNGLYWHSEERGCDKGYHYGKWRECTKKGIQLIAIWEDDWRDKRESVEHAIESLLKPRGDTSAVTPPTYDVHHMSEQQVQAFFDTYHIDGHLPGESYLGVFLGECLVAASAWRKEGACAVLERVCINSAPPVSINLLIEVGVHWLRSQGCYSIELTTEHGTIGDSLMHNSGRFQRGKELPPTKSLLVGGRRLPLSSPRAASVTDAPFIWSYGSTRWRLKL